MNEQLHNFASNYVYIIPFVALLTFLWFKMEKSKTKNTAKYAILNNGFLSRLLAFVTIITFTLVYLNKPLPGLEESIIVSPADF